MSAYSPVVLKRFEVLFVKIFISSPEVFLERSLDVSFDELSERAVWVQTCESNLRIFESLIRSAWFVLIDGFL